MIAVTGGKINLADLGFVTIDDLAPCLEGRMSYLRDLRDSG